jgi:hypothetical protein
MVIGKIPYHYSFSVCLWEKITIFRPWTNPEELSEPEIHTSFQIISFTPDPFHVSYQLLYKAEKQIYPSINDPQISEKTWKSGFQLNVLYPLQILNEMPKNARSQYNKARTTFSSSTVHRWHWCSLRSSIVCRSVWSIHTNVPCNITVCVFKFKKKF